MSDTFWICFSAAAAVCSACYTVCWVTEQVLDQRRRERKEDGK